MFLQPIDLLGTLAHEVFEVGLGQSDLVSTTVICRPLKDVLMIAIMGWHNPRLSLEVFIYLKIASAKIPFIC